MMAIRIKWFSALIRGLAAFPATVKAAIIIKRGGKELDKGADKARDHKKNLVEDIRRSGSMFLVLVALTLSGCQTTTDLRAEGYEVTRWQAIRLNICDIIIKADDIKDYEIVIGDDDAAPTGKK